MIMKKILKYSTLLLLSVLLASCYPEGFCIDADDFGFPKLTVPATGTNVTPTSCSNCVEVSQWIDSKEQLTGDTIYFEIGPPLAGNGTTSNTWTSWLGGGQAAVTQADPGSSSDASNACTFSDQQEPWITTTPERKQTNTADVLNAPCWFQNGMFLYMLSALPTSANYDPNISESTLRDPEDNGFETQHLGPYQLENDGTQCNAAIQSQPYSHSEQHHPIQAFAAADEYNHCGGWFGNSPFEANAAEGNFQQGELYFKINDNYYDDNFGGYIVVMKKGVQDVTGGPIATVLNLVRNEFVGSSTVNGTPSATQMVYTNIMGNNNYIRAVRATLTLYVMFVCIFFMFGMTQLTQGELVVRIFKIAVILALISQSSWNIFYSHFFSLFNEGLTQIINVVTNTGQTVGNSNNGGYENGVVFFDSILHSIFSFETTTKIFAIMFGQTNDAGDFIIGFVYGLLMYLFLFLFLIMLARAALMYMLCLLALGVLIALSPLFLVFFLFEWTKTFYTTWMQQLFSYMLQPILIFTALSLISNLILQQLYHTVGYRVCLNYLDYYIPWWQVSIRPDQFHMIAVPPDYLATDLRFVDAPFLDPDYGDNWNNGGNPVGSLQPYNPPHGWLGTPGNLTVDQNTGASEYADDQKLGDAINNKKYVNLQDVFVLGVYIYVLDRFWDLVVPLSRGLATVGGSNALIQGAANNLVTNTIGRAYDIAKGPNTPSWGAKGKGARAQLIKTLTLSKARHAITDPIINPIRKTISGGVSAAGKSTMISTSLKVTHGLFDPFAAANYAGDAFGKKITGGYSAERNKALNQQAQKAVNDMKEALGRQNAAVGKKKESYREALNRISNAESDHATADQKFKSLQSRHGIVANDVNRVIAAAGAGRPLANLTAGQQAEIVAAKKALDKAAANVISAKEAAHNMEHEIKGMEESTRGIQENLRGLEHNAAEAKKTPLREVSYDKVWDDFFYKHWQSKVHARMKKMDDFVNNTKSTHDFAGNMERLNSEKLDAQVRLRNARQQQDTTHALEEARKSLEDAYIGGNGRVISDAEEHYQNMHAAHEAHEKTVKDLEHSVSQKEKELKHLSEANHIGMHVDRKLVNTFRRITGGSMARASGNEMDNLEAAETRLAAAKKEFDEASHHLDADTLKNKKVTQEDHSNKLRELTDYQHQQHEETSNIRLFNKEKKRFESKVAALTKAEEKLQVERKPIQAALDERQAKMAETKKKLGEAEGQLSLTQMDKKANAAAQKTVDELKAKMDRHEVKELEIKAKLNAVDVELKKNATQMEYNTTALADKERQIKESTDHVESLKKNISEAQTDVKRIEAKLKAQGISERSAVTAFETNNKEIAALKSAPAQDAAAIAKLELEGHKLQEVISKTDNLNKQHKEQMAALEATEKELAALRGKTAPLGKEDAEALERLNLLETEQKKAVNETLALQQAHDIERADALKAMTNSAVKAVVEEAQRQERVLRPQINPDEVRMEKARKEIEAATKERDLAQGKIDALQEQRRQQDAIRASAAAAAKAKEPEVVNRKKLEEERKKFEELQDKLQEAAAISDPAKAKAETDKISKELESVRINLTKLQKANDEQEIAKLKDEVKAGENSKKELFESNRKLAKAHEEALDTEHKAKQKLGEKLDAERKKLHAATTLEREKEKAKEDLIKAHEGKVVNEAEEAKIAHAIKEHLSAITAREEIEINVAKATRAESEKGDHIQKLLSKETSDAAERVYNKNSLDAEHQRNVADLLETQKNALIEENKLKKKPDDELNQRIARLQKEHDEAVAELARINAQRDQAKANRVLDADVAFAEHKAQMDNAIDARRLLEEAKRQNQSASEIKALEVNAAAANAEILNTQLKFDHIPLTDQTKEYLNPYLHEVEALSHAYNDYYKTMSSDKNAVTPAMKQKIEEQEEAVLKQANDMNNGGVTKWMEEIRLKDEFKNNTAFHDDAITRAEEARDTAHKAWLDAVKEGTSRVNKVTKEKEAAYNKAQEELISAQILKDQLAGNGTLAHNDAQLAKIEQEMSQLTTLPKEMITTANHLFGDDSHYAPMGNRGYSSGPVAPSTPLRDSQGGDNDGVLSVPTLNVPSMLEENKVNAELMAKQAAAKVAAAKGEEIKEAKEAEAREAKEAKEAREAREAKEAEEARKLKEAKELEEARKLKEDNDKLSSENNPKSKPSGDEPKT